MMVSKPASMLLAVMMVSLVASSWVHAQDFSPANVARVVAENSEALRNYSWSLRVEATIGDAEQVGLYRPPSVSETVVTPGSRVVGRILEARRSGRRSGRARLTLALTTLYAETGPLAVESHALTIEAEGTGRRDGRRIAGASLAGTLIGVIADGGSGAAIGAAIGAGAGGAATLATRGDEVEFPAEQQLAFSLSVPVEVRGR